MAVGSLPSTALAYEGAGAPVASDSRAWRKFVRNPAALLGC